ncbi:hypothetical protein E1176_03665 [Fulvivirga sp. RKSG066]|uniref:hypothetical protein n=1 Tax=Fulvivirga aurantia TaxID=2529383 RepID=UPI0012BCAC53|nr:hypothetical protein [Fulvivirga aurantia]MTI20106.1 hypothetical protein [Fulvivirga aurantia]
MKKVLIVVISVLGLLVFSVYYYLGGTEDFVFTQVNKALYLKGEAFKGSYNDSKIESLFVNARQISTENDGYKLAILSYPMNETKVDQVVGIVSNSEINNDWESFDTSRELNGNFITTTITAHNLVMPKPNEVLEAAQEYAALQDLEIDESYTIEVYEGERKLLVYFPIK